MILYTVLRPGRIESPSPNVYADAYWVQGCVRSEVFPQTGKRFAATVERMRNAANIETILGDIIRL
jgi:hypothetical protein